MAVLHTLADDRPTTATGGRSQQAGRADPWRPDRCRLALVWLAAASLAGCAERSCNNPYVLDFLAAEDARANLAHRGLVRDAVRTWPGPAPDTAQCAIWERVANPAYGTAPQQPATVLQPQFYSVTHVGDGWRLAP